MDVRARQLTVQWETFGYAVTRCHSYNLTVSTTIIYSPPLGYYVELIRTGSRVYGKKINCQLIYYFSYLSVFYDSLMIDGKCGNESRGMHVVTGRKLT